LEIVSFYEQEEVDEILILQFVSVRIPWTWVERAKQEQITKLVIEIMLEHYSAYTESFRGQIRLNAVKCDAPQG
jgi:hypothetical protein